MTGEAYEYAQSLALPSDERKPRPAMLVELDYIDRFGVQAVKGRSVLSAGELRAMIAAENIVAAYRSRAQVKDWAKWSEEHPEYARILIEIETKNVTQ